MSYVFLLCGWLLALILGMAIVPKILLISYKKRLSTSRMDVKYIPYLFPDLADCLSSR